MITDNALKNYTTKIDPMRTAAEIDYILASNGATAIQKDITNGQITALRFMDQVFLPYVLNGDGKTLYEVARDSKFLLKGRE